jgi:hypothetical protein
MSGRSEESIPLPEGTVVVLTVSLRPPIAPGGQRVLQYAIRIHELRVLTILAVRKL